jgi:hypothetical protein
MTSEAWGKRRDEGREVSNQLELGRAVEERNLR